MEYQATRTDSKGVEHHYQGANFSNLVLDVTNDGEQGDEVQFFCVVLDLVGDVADSHYMLGFNIGMKDKQED